MPQAMLAVHRAADLVHVEAERHEWDIARHRETLIDSGRGEHGLMPGAPQPACERDERLDITL